MSAAAAAAKAVQRQRFIVMVYPLDIIWARARFLRREDLTHSGCRAFSLIERQGRAAEPRFASRNAPSPAQLHQRASWANDGRLEMSVEHKDGAE